MFAFDSSAKLNQLGEKVGAVALRMICIGGSALEKTAPGLITSLSSSLFCNEARLPESTEPRNML